MMGCNKLKSKSHDLPPTPVPYTYSRLSKALSHLRNTSHRRLCFSFWTSCLTSPMPLLQGEQTYILPLPPRVFTCECQATGEPACLLFFHTSTAGNPKTGCLLRWSLISTGYHGNLPGSGGHPSNPPGSHPDPEYTGECVEVCVPLCMSNGRASVVVYCLLALLQAARLILTTKTLLSGQEAGSKQGFISSGDFVASRIYIKGPCISCAWSPAPTTLHLRDIEFRSIERSEVRCLRSDINCDLAFLSYQ